MNELSGAAMKSAPHQIGCRRNVANVQVAAHNIQPRKKWNTWSKI